MRVEIGGGPEPRYHDFIQYDATDWKYRTGLDYVLGDIRKLPWDDRSVDEIYASNVLEHVGFRETNAVLTEWQRVLKPNGELEVVVPDILGIFADYQSGKDSWDHFVMRLYGGQGYPLDFHQAGFSLAHMSKVFEDAGFEVLYCHESHDGGGVTIAGTPRL